MKRKLFKLLASCSLAIAVIISVGTAEFVANSSTPTVIQSMIQTMGHGYGGG